MILLAFLFGLLVGSFLNVCIHRWPAEKSVVRPRSRCPECSESIAWYDNIPVLSYLALGGRCRRCGASISRRYPLVELLTGLLFVAVVWRFGLTPFAAKAALFGSMMLVLVFTDLEQYILPDEVTLGGLAVGLALTPFVPLPAGVTSLFWLMTHQDPPPWLASLAESAFAAALFGGMLWLVREAYYRFRGVDGLGLGDVKMAAMMGAFWGVGYTLMMLVIGSLAGAVLGTLFVLVAGKRWNYELPFGSYLGVAAILVMLWGDELLGTYWGLVSGAAAFE